MCASASMGNGAALGQEGGGRGKGMNGGPPSERGCCRAGLCQLKAFVEMQHIFNISLFKEYLSSED